MEESLARLASSTQAAKPCTSFKIVSLRPTSCISGQTQNPRRESQKIDVLGNAERSRTSYPEGPVFIKESNQVFGWFESEKAAAVLWRILYGCFPKTPRTNLSLVTLMELSHSISLANWRGNQKSRLPLTENQQILKQLPQHAHAPRRAPRPSPAAR